VIVVDINTQPEPSTVESTTVGPRLDRIVVGILLAAAGVGWLLDEAGASVPWRVFPACALLLIGLALIITLFAGRGRGRLIGLGVLALVAAVAVGVGADRYAGPVGDRTLAPATGDWPVNERVSAGTVTVDLTRHPLPESGDLQVQVGAGKIIVRIPDSARVGIDASATAGTITVDGVQTGNGIDLHWSQAAPATSHVTLTLGIGLGDIEVNHE